MYYNELRISESDEGSILLVKVYPSSGKMEIEGIHDGMLKVFVSAQPEKGKANIAVVKLLSKVLGITQSEIELKHGETSRKKTFLVRGLTPSEIISKLSQ
jgi:uncharacterized protein (TIGR00251 family)